MIPAIIDSDSVCITYRLSLLNLKAGVKCQLDKLEPGRYTNVVVCIMLFSIKIHGITDDGIEQ